MNRNYPKNPDLQPVKGIFIFHDTDEMQAKAELLFKSLCCQVLSTHENRFTVKTNRRNLQSIKQRWLASNVDNSLSSELKACVSQIILGGAAT